MGAESLTVIGAALFGYLCGSAPFGLLLTRLAGVGDIRAVGSGNIGATNVLRTGRKGLAAATLLGDALKGTLAVLVAGRFGYEPALLAGFFAFLGHIFPVWLGFRGGKGVATYLGVSLGFDWRLLLAFALCWLAVAFATRYSSLAALAASLVVPLTAWFIEPELVTVVLALMTVILWIKHKENIARLRAGVESRIGDKSGAKG